MKKLIALGLILVWMLSMSGCGKLNDEEVILPDNIEKITIAWNGGPLTTFSYTDSSKINILREYFTSLKLISTKKDPNEYFGGGWAITVEANSEILEMMHYGNLFFKTPEGEWWEISYEQAEELSTILKENVPDELPQNAVYEEWVD